MPISLPNYPNMSVQVIGTFDGNTVTMEGSNMITASSSFARTFVSLYDYPFTTVAAFTSEGMKYIKGFTYWVRPRLSGSNANTNVEVYLLAVTEK